ncbi:MAG: hypothetical protein JXA30_21955 [Deltaproteobacteria bacterium]|nr:hypothetical protein [Deltaproteobacteria bacterium]
MYEALFIKSMKWRNLVFVAFALLAMVACPGCDEAAQEEQQQSTFESDWLGANATRRSNSGFNQMQTGSAGDVTLNGAGYCRSACTARK